MHKPDLSIIQVEEPLNRWCSSGHTAPSTFKRDGADGVEEPTRFFKISGNNINGIYCEPCLCIAHHVAKIKKQAKGK